MAGTPDQEEQGALVLHTGRVEDHGVDQLLEQRFDDGVPTLTTCWIEVE